jgi:hypothetical protein
MHSRHFVWRTLIIIFFTVTQVPLSLNNESPQGANVISRIQAVLVTTTSQLGDPDPDTTWWSCHWLDPKMVILMT